MNVVNVLSDPSTVPAIIPGLNITSPGDVTSKLKHSQSYNKHYSTGFWLILKSTLFDTTVYTICVLQCVCEYIFLVSSNILFESNNDFKNKYILMLDYKSSHSIKKYERPCTQ